MKKNLLLITAISLSLLFAVNSCKKSGSGNDDNNATTVTIPVLSTTDITTVSQTSVNTGGNISNDGGGAIISRGVCWGSNPNPTINDNTTSDGNGSGSFSSSITNLTANKLNYYVRAYATNSVGTGYGNTLKFSTLLNSAGTITDIDGNNYQTIIVGTKKWMAEDLKVTRFSNGDKIPGSTYLPMVTDSTAWGSLYSAGFCFYDNNSANGNVYGALYNFYAVVDSRNMCPTGWHVPTDNEWMDFELSLGMTSAQVNLTGLRGTTEGDKMKEIGTEHWIGGNTSATNSSGFSGLPNGARNYDGSSFDNLGIIGSWWTSTSGGSIECYCRYLQNTYSMVGRTSTFRNSGIAVRCIEN